MTTSNLTECIHGLDDPMWCSVCRAKLGFRPGSDRHENDCTVIAVQTITGATYAEALNLLADAGRKPGKGADVTAILAALRAAGWEPTEETGDHHWAWPTSGTYLVCAWKRSGGHAFVIDNGTITNGRGWTDGIRYRIWSVK